MSTLSRMRVVGRWASSPVCAALVTGAHLNGTWAQHRQANCACIWHDEGAVPVLAMRALGCKIVVGRRASGSIRAAAASARDIGVGAKHDIIYLAEPNHDLKKVIGK